MAPQSPGTDQIETLLWIGFAAAVVVVLAVVGGLLFALRRYRSERGAEPRQARGGRGVQLRVAAALTVFAAALLAVGVVFTEKARQAPATLTGGLQEASSDSPLTITATGQQWIWRYDYPNGAFSFYKLLVPVGTTVELDLVSTDVVHTWDVPALAGKRDAVPGRGQSVVFRADEEGVYEGQSATLSGQAYPAMRTAVEAVSPAEYEDRVAQLKRDIRSAEDRVARLIEGGEGR